MKKKAIVIILAAMMAMTAVHLTARRTGRKMRRRL